MASTDPRGERVSGLRLGSVAGVPVYIGWSWLVLAAFVTAIIGPSVERQRPDLGSAS